MPTTISTTGTYTYNAGDLVDDLLKFGVAGTVTNVKCWGSGATGADNIGAGGGAAAFSQTNGPILVVANETWEVFAEASNLTGDSHVAKDSGLGATVTNAVSGVGATGGDGPSGTGDITHSGGSGGAGRDTSGGGGGEAGGPSGDGDSGTDGNLAVGGNGGHSGNTGGGGIGGDGGNALANGAASSAPGGGGGGGGATGTGAAGAAGRVVLTFTVASGGVLQSQDRTGGGMKDLTGNMR